MIEKDILIDLTNKNYSIGDIAKILNKSKSTISKWCNKYGIITKYKDSIDSYPINEVYNLYISGVGIGSLCKKYDKSRGFIINKLKLIDPDIIIRTPISVDLSKLDFNKLDLLVKQFRISSIAAQFGVKKFRILKLIKNFKIIPLKDIEYLYNNCNKSPLSIAEKFNLDVIKLKSWMKNNGIKLKKKHNTAIGNKIINNNLSVTNKSTDDIDNLTCDDIYYHLDWKKIFNNYNDCFEWLQKEGFKPLKYPKFTLDRAIELCNFNNNEKWLNSNLSYPDIIDFIKHFSPHYWSSYYKNYNCIADAFAKGNNSILYSACEELWNRQQANIYNLIKIISLKFKDYLSVSIFKPWVASYIYHKLLPSGGIVIDPCMGWGGRLLGCIGHNINYIGYDLNNYSVMANQEILKLAKINGSINLGDSSIINFPTGDLLFTSPPYDDSEYYYGIDSSKTKTDIILINIFSKFTGKIIALHLPKWLEKICAEITSNFKWAQIDVIKIKTSTLIKREKSFENIIIFKKET